jgi:hypothetical protein
MSGNALRLSAAGVMAACLAIPSLSRSPVEERGAAASELTVHEWGTFTSVAGPDGQAVEWLPLTGSTDLPGFVEHFRDEQFKCGLGGTVRMETPVLYFYTAHERNVSVKVSFTKGIITEWYPRARAPWSPRWFSLKNILTAAFDGMKCASYRVLMPRSRRAIAITTTTPRGTRLPHRCE